MAKALNFTFLTLAITSACGVGYAQTATPINITSGFNQDVIADGSSAIGSTTAGIDGIDVFYTSAYATDHSISGGSIAAGQTILGNDGNSYTFASSTANNGLLLNSGTTAGTLNFTPTTLGTLDLLGTATSSSGSAILDYTLDFSGGATATGTITFSDWYDPSATGAVTGLGRTSSTTDSYDSATGNKFSLYSISISIPVADQSLTLDDIALTYDNSNPSGSSVVVMAASGSAPAAVPEPGTLALAAAGLGLVASLRRKK